MVKISHMNSTHGKNATCILKWNIGTHMILDY